MTDGRSLTVELPTVVGENSSVCLVNKWGQKRDASAGILKSVPNSVLTLILKFKLVEERGTKKQSECHNNSTCTYSGTPPGHSILHITHMLSCWSKMELHVLQSAANSLISTPGSLCFSPVEKGFHELPRPTPRYTWSRLPNKGSNTSVASWREKNHILL